SVTIGGINAPLYYVSPGQLNVQIPYETPLNQASIVAVNNNGRISSTTLTVASAAPGLFTDAGGAVVPTATVARGAVLTLYLTGVGAVSPAMATGAGSILFEGIPTTLVGVAQINLRIPATAPLGTEPVVVAIGGVASAPATIFVTAQ